MSTPVYHFWTIFAKINLKRNDARLLISDRAFEKIGLLLSSSAVSVATQTPYTSLRVYGFTYLRFTIFFS